MFRLEVAHDGFALVDVHQPPSARQFGDDGRVLPHRADHPQRALTLGVQASDVGRDRVERVTQLPHDFLLAAAQRFVAFGCAARLRDLFETRAQQSVALVHGIGVLVSMPARYARYARYISTWLSKRS